MIKVDGAWRAIYADVLWGQGIVVLQSGKLLGCDSQYLYEGTYEPTSDGKISAHLKVQHYAGDPRTIFGEFGSLKLVQYTAQLTSTEIHEELILFTGVMNGNPDLTFAVRLERLIP